MVSWFWLLQHQEFSSKRLAAEEAWQELIPLLQHLDEQGAPKPTQPDYEPQPKNYITADLSTHSFLTQYYISGPQA